MAKIGVSKITGPKNPKIGEPATYKVVDWYPSTPMTQRAGRNVKWELFRKRANGKYTTTNIIKKGIEATFVFEEKSFGREFFVEGYLNAPEKKGDTTVHIVPQRGTPKINGLRLLDNNKQELKTKPKYGQTLYAEIKTQNLFNEKIQLQVWERDTILSQGHDADDNTLLKEETVTVNLNGINYVKIFLSNLMMKKAQGYNPFEGEHEYYLVVKLKGKPYHSTQTVQVLNEKMQVEGHGTNPPPENTRTASSVGYTEVKEEKEVEEIFEKNIVTYHIYHDGKIEKHIPKNIKEGYESKYQYVYHDEENEKYCIGIFNYKTIKNVYGSLYGGKTVDLIDIRDVPNYSQKGIKFKLRVNTVRYYINSKTLASLLGAMLRCSYEDYVFNGFSHQDGSSRPSTSHKNGYNGDLRYLRKDKSGGRTDLFEKDGIGWAGLDEERQNKFNDALYDFGWKSMLSQYYGDDKNKILNHCKNDKFRNHNDHLHIQGYKPTYTEKKL